MGLDNGIKVMHKEGKKIYIPKKCYEYQYSFGDNPHYEIAYWRKCWGIRNAIITMFVDEALYDSYDIVLDRDDIKKLIGLMKKFTKEYIGISTLILYGPTMNLKVIKKE